MLASNSEIKKAKGIKKDIIKNPITHNHYKISLQNNRSLIKRIKQKMKSRNHNVYTSDSKSL